MARILAIHGLGCSADQGWPRVRKLVPMEVARLDGADGAAKLPSSEWGVLAQARRIARSANDIDLLIGHSMGGAIAVRIAEISRPRALMLIEPHVVPSAGFVVKPALEWGPTPAFFDAMAKIDTGEGTYAEWIRRWDWRAFHAMSQELAAGDGAPGAWADAWAALELPTTLVWGAKSGPPERDLHMRALVERGADITVVEGSAHFVPSEAPEALAGLVLRAT